MEVEMFRALSFGVFVGLAYGLLLTRFGAIATSVLFLFLVYYDPIEVLFP